MAVAIFVAAGAVHAVSAQTDGAAMSVANGAIWGDVGGAHLTWNMDIPSGSKIDLNFYPCFAPHAVQLYAYGAGGAMSQATSTGGCSKTLTVGTGGPTLLQLSSHLHGMETFWNLSSSDVSLPGSAAPAAPAAAAAPMAPAATDASMADDKMAADADMAPAAPMAAAPAAPAAPTGAMAGTLLGNNGGAFASFNLPVEEGKTYTLRMPRDADRGGNWNGLGFKVWGPNGLVTTSSTWHGDPATATFKATMDGMYQVVVHNYHHGMTLFYAVTSESQDSM